MSRTERSERRAEALNAEGSRQSSYARRYARDRDRILTLRESASSLQWRGAVARGWQLGASARTLSGQYPIAVADAPSES